MGDKPKPKGARTNSIASSDINNIASAEIWICEICKIPWSTQNDKMLECEFCTLRYCCKCLKIKASEYSAIGNTNCMWFCPPCRIKVEKQIVVEKEIEERCDTYLTSFRAKIEEMEQKLESKCDKTEVEHIILNQLSAEEYAKKDEVIKIVKQELGNLTTASKSDNKEDLVNESLKQLRDRTNREPNIIIYRIPEPKTNLKDEIIKHDTNFLKELCEEVCKVSIDVEADITKIIRLGKKDTTAQAGSVKIRPVLVSFKNPQRKKQLA